MATRSLFDDDDEPTPRRVREVEVDAQELLELLRHPKFRLLQNINGWVAYSKSDSGGDSFRFGGGKDPVTALRQSLGIKR